MNTSSTPTSKQPHCKPTRSGREPERAPAGTSKKGLWLWLRLTTLVRTENNTLTKSVRRAESETRSTHNPKDDWWLKHVCLKHERRRGEASTTHHSPTITGKVGCGTGTGTASKAKPSMTSKTRSLKNARNARENVPGRLEERLLLHPRGQLQSLRGWPSHPR